MHKKGQFQLVFVICNNLFRFSAANSISQYQIQQFKFVQFISRLFCSNLAKVLDRGAGAPGDVSVHLEVGQLDQLLVDDEILHATDVLLVAGLEAAHVGVAVLAHEQRMGDVGGGGTYTDARHRRNFVHRQRHQSLRLDDCKRKSQ
jgi:hypothetical protein